MRHARTENPLTKPEILNLIRGAGKLTGRYGLPYEDKALESVHIYRHVLDPKAILMQFSLGYSEGYAALKASNEPIVWERPDYAAMYAEEDSAEEAYDGYESISITPSALAKTERQIPKTQRVGLAANPVQYSQLGDGFPSVFFHGTRLNKTADNIIADGLLVPGIHTEDTATVPVKGAVYMSADLGYATIYALGCAYIGQRIPQSKIRQYGKYGFIFEIPADRLMFVQPDEDRIGEMVCRGKIDWLDELAEDALAGVYTQYPELYEEDFGYGLLKLVMRGEYAAWAEAGRILVDEMNDDQLAELIQRGLAIAHIGPVAPSRCWRLDRSRTAELEPDCSNLFEVAELYWEE